MENKQLKLLIPFLDVRNISNALAFYTDKLAFQAEFRYAEDPDNYAGVFRDNVYLHMQRQSEKARITKSF